jgi:hypothetical protein
LPFLRRSSSGNELVGSAASAAQSSAAARALSPDSAAMRISVPVSGSSSPIA